MAKLFTLCLLVCTPWCAWGAVSETPVQAPQGVLDTGSAIQLVLGLFLVLLMIFASAWLVKRLGRWQGSYSDQLKVVAGLAVGARERIVVVQVGEQQILVGISPGNMRTLHVLEKPLALKSANDNEPLIEKFAAILKKQQKQE